VVKHDIKAKVWEVRGWPLADAPLYYNTLYLLLWLLLLLLLPVPTLTSVNPLLLASIDNHNNINQRVLFDLTNLPFFFLPTSQEDIHHSVWTKEEVRREGGGERMESSSHYGVISTK